MKVGDIVRQSGKLVEFRGKMGERVASVGNALGVVLEIHSREGQHARWQQMLGRKVTVMWSNNRIMNVAENSIAVIEDD